MTKPRSRQRKYRVLSTLQGSGIKLCALGLVFLIAPWFLNSSPMLTGISTALRAPGWLALVAGAMLLGLHRLNKLELTLASPKSRLTPQAPATVETKMLRDIRVALVRQPLESDLSVSEPRQATSRA